MADPRKFREWLQGLGPEDRRYLERHPTWKRSYLQFQEKGILPEGFAELTMEILEGGSESET
ncbi:MAG TPA: hypothetical protein VHE12_06950 [bacterium]|nr:hypothetical protein [bacterium]